PASPVHVRGVTVNSVTRPLALTSSILTGLVMCGALALVVWSWAFAPGAAAQGVDVAITELDCNADPEVIVVSNEAATPVDMLGGNLKSEPTTGKSRP